MFFCEVVVVCWCCMWWFCILYTFSFYVSYLVIFVFVLFLGEAGRPSPF